MTDADYAQVVEASWALGSYTTEDTLTPAAMEIIFSAVGADEAVFNALDLDTGLVTASAYPEVSLAPALRAGLAEVLDDHPFGAHVAATHAVQPVRMSDILPFQQFERSRTYQTLFRPRALRRQLVIPVEIRKSGRAGMVYAVNRCGPDFGQREVDLAMLLQPVLAAHHAARRVPMADKDQGEVRERWRLTVREAETLGLMAQGMMAVQIGHRLGISVGTVRKHLENAYAKLDVHDRVEAVNRCRAIGLVG